MNRNGNVSVLGAVILLVIIVVGGYGWVMNIVKLVGSDFAQITGVLVVRTVGIFMAPLGIVMGYF